MAKKEKNTGLGRGLDSLIPKVEETEIEEGISLEDLLRESEDESKTLATITYQNLFRMYKKIAGMTGTAMTEEKEFQEIYALDVIEIPTNKPMARQDLNDVIYRSEKSKLKS